MKRNKKIVQLSDFVRVFFVNISVNVLYTHNSTVVLLIISMGMGWVATGTGIVHSSVLFYCK